MFALEHREDMSPSPGMPAAITSFVSYVHYLATTLLKPLYLSTPERLHSHP